ncbi:MAG: diguanylate cyclase [Lachnospiraceae bacterium]|nr:diguanylate cyclase [Lachnospiraceae bacterium]
MRSIRTKLFFLIFGSMLGLFALMSCVSIYLLNKAIEEDIASSMDMIIREKSFDLNGNFNRVENGTKELEKFVNNNLDTRLLRSNVEYKNGFYEDFADKCVDVCGIVGDVAAVYFRAEPEKFGSKSGVFMTANSNGELINVEPADISQYSKSDRDYVAWYYEPLEKGSATWVKPYHNKNINVYMMSYVIPIYKSNAFVGVVGMDIKMSAVNTIVDSLDYKNAFAFLLSDDGDIIYHKDYPEGVEMKQFNPDMKATAKYLTPQVAYKNEMHKCIWKSKEHRMLANTLDNDMVVAVCVPEEQIMRISRSMKIQLVAIFCLVIMVVFAVFWRLMVIIVLPIRELTQASTRIAKGELNTVITYKSKDEIGTLAKSVSKMALEIKDYFSYIHSQAYSDAMTGVGNKAAYMDVVKRMDEKISEGMAAFIVIVFDVNGLKSVNDNLGHEYGDMLITDAADIMKRVFSAENVFRIGGDEFIVVIENQNDDNIAEYFTVFDEQVKEFNTQNARYEHDLAVSKGGVSYVQNVDEAYKDVFKRADELMYKDKEEFYRGRNDRRKR